MIDGFSILLPTYNFLPCLKLCLKSIEKHSSLNNQICIHVDGSTDDTIEWLEKSGYSFTKDRHIGAFTAWNKCGEQARKEYVFLAEDDLFFGPSWDVNLARWIEELSENHIVLSKLVEPFPGSFLPIVDCGRTWDTFKEEEFIEYVLSAQKRELIPQVFGLFAVKTELWRKVEGYDTTYDPTGLGDRDLQMKLKREKPDVKFVMAMDVLIYHLRPAGEERYGPSPPSNPEKFQKKWGMNVEEAGRCLEG